MKLAPLAPLFERPGPWATVYVDTSVADEATLDRRELQARQVTRDLTEQGADEATCRAVREALGAYSHGAGAAGRALFAAHGEVVLDPPLSVRPPRESSSTWSPLPHVGPLLELAPAEPVCLVAYIDRTGADFELRTEVEKQPAGQVTGRTWPIHRTSSVDWSERHFQLSVENTWEENAQTVAEALQRCQEETGADLIVLAGDERERRYVRDRLPQNLAATAVETDRAGRAAGSATPLLDEDIARAREEYVRRRTADELEHFQEARTLSGGHLDAAEGIPALIEAAREHRIDTLFLRPDGPDVHREIWAGPDPDQIALRRTDARSLGEPEPFAAPADDALLRSVAMTDAEAVLLPTNDAGDGDSAGTTPVGGLGALLRWSYGGEHSQPEAGTR
ncbi:Vms1/Ankzf1 family peptidyl-tRNA hydrolase [Streptomyces sp. NPDC051322]|uniref:baeRF2 domain-containing protein n=1 Tax=Streptomyces sp. NPDC051322 TaxID=3154645 RepID=UPI00344ECA62